MTPDRTDANPDENAEHGVLDESGNLDTASITILGGHIAQVSVDLPVTRDDDDLDDDVIEDEIPFDDADLAALDDSSARHELASGTEHEVDSAVDDADVAVEVDELATDEIILEPHDDDPHSDDAGSDHAGSRAATIDADVHDADVHDADVHDADIVGEDAHDRRGDSLADGLGGEHQDAADSAVYGGDDGETPADEVAVDRDAVGHEGDGEISGGDVLDGDGLAGDVLDGDVFAGDGLAVGDAEPTEHGDDPRDEHDGADAEPTEHGDDPRDEHDGADAPADVDGEVSVTEESGDAAADPDGMPTRDAAETLPHDERPDAGDEPVAAEHSADDGAGEQLRDDDVAGDDPAGDDVARDDLAGDDAAGSDGAPDAAMTDDAVPEDAVEPVNDESAHAESAHDESADPAPTPKADAQDDLAHAAPGTAAPAPADDVADDLHDVEIVDDVELFEADAAEPLDVEPLVEEPLDEEPLEDEPLDVSAEPLTYAPWIPTESAGTVSEDELDDEVVEAAIDDDARDDEGSSENTAAPGDARAADDALLLTARVAEEPASARLDGARPQTGASAVAPSTPAAAAKATTGSAPTAATRTGSIPTTRAERAATGVIGTVPLTRRQAHQADDAARTAEEAARVDRAHAMERVRTPAPEVTLTSKRIGEIDDSRESADLLTADRLLDPKQITRPEPEGLWQQLVYSASRHRINLGDGRRARQRKDLDRRIAAPLTGGARFVPVLSRKGGVGKTTVTSLLGMALADARDDRIIAVDANPDRGTLADRVGRPNGRTVRDLVRAHDEMAGYNDVSSIVARDATRLDVLASDADPRQSEAFSDDDYRQVADVAAHYYSIVLTDTGTGIVHSVMGATLELADTLVIVAGLSVDEARLASETLTWLETNGYAARVRDAVVVLNNSRPGAPLVRENELESHFRSRVRTVIRMPYDARIAAGSAITFRDLQPSTRQAARELAAAVVEGLRVSVATA